MDRLLSEQAVLDTINKWKQGMNLYRLIKAIPPADEDEWVKRSDVLRVIDKRVDERLLDPYKGMTNGEVVKAIFNTKMIDDRYLWESLKVLICGEDDAWWNSPYEGGQE